MQLNQGFVCREIVKDQFYKVKVGRQFRFQYEIVAVNQAFSPTKLKSISEPLR